MSFRNIIDNCTDRNHAVLNHVMLMLTLFWQPLVMNLLAILLANYPTTAIKGFSPFKYLKHALLLH